MFKFGEISSMSQMLSQKSNILRDEKAAAYSGRFYRWQGHTMGSPQALYASDQNLKDTRTKRINAVKLFSGKKFPLNSALRGKLAFIAHEYPP